MTIFVYHMVRMVVNIIGVVTSAVAPISDKTFLIFNFKELGNSQEFSVKLDAPHLTITSHPLVAFAVQIRQRQLVRSPRWKKRVDRFVELKYLSLSFDIIAVI